MRKKIHKYKLAKKPYRLNKTKNILYGNYGIKSLNSGLINYRHIENIRRKLSKQLKKFNNVNKTKIYIRITKWKPYTNKPMLSRMGKGAGVITRWNTKITKGDIFIELSSLEKNKQIEIIIKTSVKTFPLKVVLIKK